MKKFLLHPITIIAIILVLIVVLTLCGFKVTYNPSLNNNWDAISACAGWASVIASFVAILVAISIPKRIARQQNDIALLEKRISFHLEFCKCISFCEGLDTVETNIEAQRMFYTMFSTETLECNSDELIKRIVPMQMKLVANLHPGKYLFDFEIDEFFDPVVKGIINILYAKDPETFSCCRERLKKFGAEAKDRLEAKFEEALKLAR